MHTDTVKWWWTRVFSLCCSSQYLSLIFKLFDYIVIPVKTALVTALWMLQKTVMYCFSSFSNVQLDVLKGSASLQFIIHLKVQIYLIKFQIQLLSLLKFTFNISHYSFYLFIYWTWRNDFISARGILFCAGRQKHMNNFMIKKIDQIKLHISFPESNMCLQIPNNVWL